MYSTLRGGGGGVLPYMAYMGTCYWTGYGFRPLCPKQGNLYINFYASVLNRVWFNTIVVIKYGLCGI